MRQRIGYVFGGDRGLYDRLSALDNLRYFAELYGVIPRCSGSGSTSCSSSSASNGREKERVEGFSRGMRQRLHIARGSCTTRRSCSSTSRRSASTRWRARAAPMIAGLRDAGKTVLLTTHYMFEADELCDRIAVITHGGILAEGTPRDLKAASARARSSRSRSTGSTTTRSTACARSTA